MINFISIKNYSKDRENCDKGILFENFIKKILDKMGYQDIRGRVKENSLEYDFTGIHTIQGDKLVGEAKALEKKIDSTIITSFIGKMQPHWLKQNGKTKTMGLFITTSELTAEAEDYLNSIKDSIYFRLIDKNNIFGLIERSFTVPATKYIKEQLQDKTKLKIYDIKFIITDIGEFYLIYFSSSDKLLATQYTIIDKSLHFISDNQLTEVLKKKWSELNDLEFLILKDDYQVGKIKSESTFEIKKSKILYSDQLFDYKLPVSPEHFIGRDNLISTFSGFFGEKIKNNRCRLVFQIISRSGVGKSSALLKIADIFKEKCVLITKDVREIKSMLDFELLKKEIIFITNKELGIDSADDLNRNFLETIDGVLLKNKKSLVILLDQFESLFSSEDIFEAVLDFIKDCFQITKRVIFVIARKNDQPTTYDEKSKIDLKSLNDLSKIYPLKDFTKTEATQIFNNLEDELKQKINNTLKNLILEFSRGFPWLLKRLCFHLIQQVNKGIPIDSIVKSSLNLEDLFDEEFNELDENEKDHFLRIIRVLPATINELSILFEDKDSLFSLLKRFQDKRLIRLSGSTYDTYNDVLKEYLLNGRIADFSLSFLFRRAFYSSISILKEIIKKRSIDIEVFKKEKNFSDGTFFNKIKEIRNLKLINYDQKLGIIEVSKEIINAYENNNLSSFIRSRIRRNAVVTDLIALLNQRSSIDFDNIKTFIKNEFPLINANEKTWDLYTRNLIDWLKSVAILEERNGIYFLNQESTQELALTLGNFDHIHSKGRGKGPFPYVPSVRVNVLIGILNKNVKGFIIEDTLSKKEKIALSNAIKLKLVENKLGRNVITLQGKSFMEDERFKIRFIRNLFISLKLLREFLYYLLEQDDQEVVKSAFEEYAKDIGWSRTTLDWMSKLVVNWLEEGELAIRHSRRKLFPNKKNIEALLQE